MITKEEFLNYRPCEEAIDYCASQCNWDLALAWDKCNRLDWIFWLLRRANLIKDDSAIKLAKRFAIDAKQTARLHSTQIDFDKLSFDRIRILEVYCIESILVIQDKAYLIGDYASKLLPDRHFFLHKQKLYCSWVRKEIGNPFKQ